MNQGSLLIALAALIGVVGNSHADGCRDTALRAGEWREEIRLKPKPEGPRFYYRTLEDSYVIFVAPESVERVLKSSHPVHDRAGSELLALLTTDLPLLQHTDLFRYALVDSTYQHRIEGVLAMLLEEGNAAVLYTGTNQFLGTVDLKRENSDSGVSRDFRGPHDEMLLWILDCIADGT